MPWNGSMASSRAHTWKIAHHLYSAGRLADAARTTRALMTAGDAADAMYAADEAVRHYRRALEVSRDAGGDQATALRVEERLADLLALLGDRAAAMERYTTLDAAHDAPGAAVDRARVVRKMGTLHWQGGDRDQAMACYRRALATLEGSSAHVEARISIRSWGGPPFAAATIGRRSEWAERALQSAEIALADASDRHA
jgi:adenylate cyclase